MRKAVTLASVVVVIGVILFMLSRLPAVYDTDLSQVGTGRPAAVLVHDHNTVDSIVLMQDLDRVRSDYEPALALLLADFLHPDGRAFAQRHDLPRASLTLFNARGERVATYDRHRERDDLVGFLEQQARPLMR